MRSPVLVLLLLGAGCAASRDVPVATVADSAGIFVVTNPPGLVASVPTWTVGPEPAIDIASPDDGSFTLFRVGDVAPLPHGRIAVLNTGQHQVLVFDGKGRLIAILGGEGEGPGEFERPSAVVAMQGDSVGVYDGARRRLSVFDAAGALGRDVTLLDLRSPNGYQELYGLRDGSLLLGDHEGFGTHEGVFREAVDVWSLSPAGDMEGILGTFPGWEHFVGRYAGAVAGQVTFGAGFCLTPFGSGFAVGTTEAPELRLYDGAGGLNTLVRWPDHDRAVTDERFEAFATAALASVPANARDDVRKTLEAIPRAERVPAYQDVLASDEDRLWLSDYGSPTEVYPGERPATHHWLVLGADGVVQARATTPAGFRATAVRGGLLYGVFIDDLGVESVRVYTVTGM